MTAAWRRRSSATRSTNCCALSLTDPVRRIDTDMLARVAPRPTLIPVAVVMRHDGISLHVSCPFHAEETDRRVRWHCARGHWHGSAGDDPPWQRIGTCRMRSWGFRVPHCLADRGADYLVL